MRLLPTLPEFLERARRGNLIPVFTEVLADLDTPVSVFRKLEAGSPFAFLLESVEQGEHLGRYSFLGADPLVVFKARGAEQEVVFASEEQDFRTRETPLETLRHLMNHYLRVEDERLPDFSGGAVGYLSYDVVRQFERLPDDLPDELGLPDALFMIADTLVAFDHVRHRMVLIAHAHVAEDGDGERAYERAAARLEKLLARLSAPEERGKLLDVSGVEPTADAVTSNPVAREHLGDSTLAVRSSFTRADWFSAIAKAKEYILAGDIFQVVLSQRLASPHTCPPFDFYRALRAVNPSPYMFHLKCGELAISGSSPEILVRCKDRRVTVRPIAGTRRRGADRAADEALAAELLADPKERAEHVMLVDLGRNDVGRVSTPGTVTVDAFMTVERYSHVMHIVSNVVGELAADHDALDALRVCFPAGTVSGAPKIRAMEIIDELEPVRRGPYAGSVVYFGFDGNMDSCITLRTAILKGGTAYVQAGAGIVADSDPQLEYEETLNKARALLRALELAEAGLG
ncbi:MAG: anthranilate synthase component I [Candidatus Sumerlaeia bacterium]|nr:anthranilate synthase component I [Candidatus Sumerlaeia bacterium]